MKPEDKKPKPGHCKKCGEPPPWPIIEGTVLRNVPQVDWAGKTTFTRLDVKDETGGDIHITVAMTHPLSKAAAGARIIVAQE
jgi:hypothetical protein